MTAMSPRLLAEAGEEVPVGAPIADDLGRASPQSPVQRSMPRRGSRAAGRTRAGKPGRTGSRDETGAAGKAAQRPRPPATAPAATLPGRGRGPHPRLAQGAAAGGRTGAGPRPAGRRRASRSPTTSPTSRRCAACPTAAARRRPPRRRPPRCIVRPRCRGRASPTFAPGLAESNAGRRDAVWAGFAAASLRAATGAEALHRPRRPAAAARPRSTPTPTARRLGAPPRRRRGRRPT